MQTPSLAHLRAGISAAPGPLARSAALAALALVDPNRGRLHKAAFIGGTAAVAAWAVYDTDVADVPDEFALGDAGRLGWAVAAGTITCALAGPTVRWDARVMRAMRRWRVPAPRVVLAALTFGVAWLSETYRPADAAVDDEVDADDGPVEPLDARIEALTRALLSQNDDYGTPELLAQLETAEQHHSEDGTWQQFHVDDSAPRTILRDYIFPAWGHYTHEGRDITIALAIDDGKLHSLNQWYLVEDDDDSDFGASLPWPDVSEVTFAIGTPS